MFSTDLLKVIACPWCVTRPETGKNVLAKGELELLGKADAPTGLKCKQCGRTYGFLENGVPNLLIEEATTTEKKI